MYIYQGRVAFHETDAAGIVHFTHFFRYAEEAETHALDHVGLLRAASSAGMLIPRVHVEADYLKPLRFWEKYSVQAKLLKIGASSMHWQFDIMQEQDCCAQIRWVSARIDARGQKVPYSAEEVEQLNSLM